MNDLLRDSSGDVHIDGPFSELVQVFPADGQSIALNENTISGLSISARFRLGVGVGATPGKYEFILSIWSVDGQGKSIAQAVCTVGLSPGMSVEILASAVHLNPTAGKYECHVLLSVSTPGKESPESSEKTYAYTVVSREDANVA